MKANFRFLTDYGFRLEEEATNSIGYAARAVLVCIYHEPYSFEMGVRVTLRDNNQQAELWDIPEYGNAPERIAFRERTMFQTGSADGVKKLAPEMARLVREYGEPFLTGSTPAFEAAEKAKASASAALITKWKLADVRAKAEAAWHNHAFAELVSLYAPVRQHLTAAELKTLDYSERQLQRKPRSDC